MFSKKIVPDFTPRRPFVKTKETATAPVPDINLPTRILISESQKVLPKAAPQFIPSNTRHEYVSLTSPLVTPKLIQGTPLTHAPVFDPTPIPGGNVSYSPSMETFASIGESYFKLSSDMSGNASQWSLYPALDSVQMNTRSLINVGGITGFLCQMNTVQALHGMITPNILTSTITVNTGVINMIDNTGNHVLEAIGGDLFFDTQLLAKAGDLSNVADWSLYPALSTVNYNNEAMVGVSTINGQPLSYYTIANWSQTPAISTINASSYDIANVSTINGISYPPPGTSAASWANYPAISTLNMALNDIANVSTINGIAFPPPASGVASVNGQTGAVTITGDVSTITATLVGTDTQLGAPTLGTSGDLYPVNDTSWGKANYASLNATSAGLAAGGAATAAAAAQASADAAAITAAAALADATAALAQSGITSVNGGSYAATIAAGSGIGVTTTYSSGTTNPTVTISATGTAGVTTLNTLSGALTLAAGTGISVTPSGGNTLTVANTATGTSFVASYDIYVAPNGNDTTGTGSANNPYLTIAKAITVRATLSLSNEVSIRLASGTYAESAILIANTYLVGVVTGEADQPVNITGNITMNGATGQSGIVGLQLNAPTNGANVTISGAGTFAINNCNITAGVSASPACYILNHSSTGTCYMTECRMTCSPTNSVEGITGSATLIMRDCFMGTAGSAGMILYQGNLTVRQCNLVSTSASSGVNGIILYQPSVANRTCEVSYSVLQYTSAATGTLKGCIVVSNGAATALVNIVNNLLICEGTTNGSPGNYHCIWKTSASAGNACTMSYGNLLGGATAHNIDANITKTAFSAVP